MNKIIFSLFAIYELSSGSRLLAETAARRLIIPTTTSAPATTAGAFTPPAFNIIPNAGNPQNNPNAPVGELTCDFGCRTSLDCPSQCARQRVQLDANGVAVPGTGPLTVTAGNFFQFTCAAPGACAASDIIMQATGRYIEMMDFSEQYAVYGSVITVNNDNPNQRTEIRNVDCGEGFCEGATFVFNGIDLGDFHCSPVDIGKGCGNTCTLIIDGISQTCNSVATW